MPKLLIPIPKLDHPEQFDDLIREFESPERQYPTPLENLLYELAGHRCTICQAPWMELHHIKELSEGGTTTYENLIVLCPNCHTRVHQDKTPTASELRHYKLKQEIAYELPAFGRLKESDRYVLKFFGELTDAEIPLRDLVSEYSTKDGDQEAARQECRREAAGYLQECGIVVLEIVHVGIGPGLAHLVKFRVRLTAKGIKWLRYLRDSGKIAALTDPPDDVVAVAVPGEALT